MSSQIVETILTRAMNDAAFSDLLFANPETALKGYDLTTEEMNGLKTMSRANFEQHLKASPEERKSFGRIISFFHRPSDDGGG